MSTKIILPEEIWVAGKGASFETYNWRKAGTHRIGINETAFLIPKCWGAIAIDYKVLDKYLEQLNPSITLFRKIRHDKYRFPNMYLWTPQIEATNLHATATIGLQIFHYLGARKMHLVGFDSVDGEGSYAKSITDIGAEGDNKHGYKDVNVHLLKTIERLNIEAVWEHRNES